MEPCVNRVQSHALLWKRWRMHWNCKVTHYVNKVDITNTVLCRISNLWKASNCACLHQHNHLQVQVWVAQAFVRNCTAGLLIAWLHGLLCRFCCTCKNAGYSIFLQVSTFWFLSLEELVIGEVVQTHTCIMRKLEVWPDVSSDSVNPFLHQQLIFRQCVQDKRLLLTSIRRALRYTTMISTWHEDSLGA